MSTWTGLGDNTELFLGGSVIGSSLWPSSKLLLWVIKAMMESLLHAECRKWWRWLAWVPKEQPDEKDGDGGLKLEWQSGSEVVEKRRAILSFYRGSPWCNSCGIPTTCGRIGRGFGAMAATVRRHGVIDDMRQVEHRYVDGQTTVKTWSWCKKWDEKNIYGWELSVFSLMRSSSWIYDDWISFTSRTKKPVMAIS
jgi:hypothetical protein